MALRIGELVGFIRADDSGMRRGLSDAELRMRGFQRDTEGRLRDLNGRFASMSALATAGLGDAADSGNRLSFSLGGIVRTAGGLAGVAGSLAGMVAPLGAAVPLAAGLAAALASVAPAAAVAAPAVLGLVSATAALKIGMLGVSDAVSAAFEAENAAELEEALKGLSPAARAFVVELHGMKDSFDALKTGVQDALFKDLDSVLEKTGAATLPVLRKALTESATALNGMAKGAGEAATKLARNGTLGQAFEGANDMLRELQGAPGLVVQAFGQISAAAAPSLTRLTSGWSEAIDSMSGRLDEAFESGAMERAIETAIDLGRDLFEVIGNIGGIVESVFGAADASGAGFLGTLKTITGALEEAFAGPEVQGALRALFETMGELAETAGPLLVQALEAIAPVLTELGPPVQRLISELGDALGPVIEALGPVLEEVAGAVGEVIDAFLPFLPVISDLLVMALEPLAPIIRKLADVFVKMSPLIADLADQLGPLLTPILMALGEVAIELVEQFGDQMIALMPQLIEAAIELAPVFIQLAESLGEILTELAPLIPELMLLGTTFIAQILPAIQPLLPAITKLASIFLHLATGAITGIVIPALDKLIGFITGMREKMQPFIDAARAVTEKVVGAFRWLYDVLVGNSVIPDTVRAIVNWFKGLPGKVASAIANLGPTMYAKARDAGARMVGAVRSKVGEAVGVARGLPGRVAGALGGLGGRLWNAGASLIQGFINGIRARIPSVRSVLGGLTSSLTSWKGPEALDKRILTPSGEWVMQGFERGIEARIPAIRNLLGSLTGDFPEFTAGVRAQPAWARMAHAQQASAGAGRDRPQTVRVVLDVNGGQRDLVRMVQDWVRSDGRGDVASLAWG